MAKSEHYNMESNMHRLDIHDSCNTMLVVDYDADYDQNSDAEIHSPNEMMVDPDDYVVELPQNEKDDIAIINPDQLDGMDEIAALPRADDCKHPRLTYTYPTI